ncbi:hypothetical protein ABI59_01370 [Acidobacteria bacterium Mor1]|nr:hypothetical protein ABI59_01370 [Acidobacteria bacterium Mor1]
MLGLASGALLLVALLAATLGEGGADPHSVLFWHGILVAAVALAILDRRSGHGLDRSQQVALGLFFAGVVAGAALAPFAYGAWIMALEVAAALAVVWLAARSGPGLLPRAVPVLFGAGVLQACWVLTQLLAFGEKRPAGTFLNTNHLGAWIGATLLLGCGLLSGRRRKDPWVIALCVPLAAALLATGSRGAVLGFGVGLLLLIARSLPRLSTRARVAVAAVLVLGAGLAGWRQYQRFQSADPFSSHRLLIWKASVAPALEHPWTGAGPRQFRTEASNLRFADGDGPLRFDRSFIATHSDLLRPFAELGWPTALALVAAGLLGLRRLLRERRRLSRFEGAAVAALAALGTQALVDNLSERPGVYLLAAFLWGVLGSSRRDGQPAGSTSPSMFRAVALVPLLLVFVVGDLAPWQSWRLQQEQAALPAAQRDPAKLAGSIALNPIHPEPRRLMAERHAATMQGDPAAYAAARLQAERAVALHPAESRYRLAAARIEAAACRELFRDVATRRRAAQRFREAAERSRYDPFPLLEMGAFLLETGDPAGARAATEDALGLEPGAVSPRLLLADVLLAEGGEGSRDRARRLLHEARERAAETERFAAENLYSERLLTLDPRAVDRIESRLAEIEP